MEEMDLRQVPKTLRQFKFNKTRLALGVLEHNTLKLAAFNTFSRNQYFSTNRGSLCCFFFSPVLSFEFRKYLKFTAKFERMKQVQPQKYFLLGH